MADRPHVLFVVTDQQRYDTVGALGADHADTPNLDALVRDGTAFTDCHVTALSCAPSRASLFSGRYPHTTGVYRNSDRWSRTWVEHLADAGYHCVNVGKMHTRPFEADAGFHERYVVENKDRHLGDPHYKDEWDRALRARGLDKPGRVQYRELPDYDERLGAVEWPLPTDAHPDAFVGNLAEWWLDEMPEPDGPLFLQVGFPGPHPPYDPPAEYLDRYDGVEMPDAVGTGESVAAQPPAYHDLREHNAEVDHDAVDWDLDPDGSQIARLRRHYMANVSLVDDWVGRLRAALSRNGYDDVVVVFTSDHGDALGDHGHVQKWTAYESVTHVPLVVAGPDVAEGHTARGLCQLFDVGPTVLDLAGVETPGAVAAESLLPALEGEPWHGRDAVYAEQAGDAILQGTEFLSMVRTDDWKLVHFVEGEGQLFDLETDPDETTDLWDDPEYQDVKRDLLDDLFAWRVRDGLRTGDWAAGAR